MSLAWPIQPRKVPIRYGNTMLKHFLSESIAPQRFPHDRTNPDCDRKPTGHPVIRNWICSRWTDCIQIDIKNVRADCCGVVRPWKSKFCFGQGFQVAVKRSNPSQPSAVVSTYLEFTPCISPPKKRIISPWKVAAISVRHPVVLESA